MQIRKPLFPVLDEIQEDLCDESIPDMIRNMFNDYYETEQLVVVPRSDMQS